MPRVKKSFIDKTKAATYHLLYRPGENENAEDPQRVFVRTDNNAGDDYDSVEEDFDDDLFEDEEPTELEKSRKEAEMRSLGITIDGYDYTQHLRVVSEASSGSGDTVFVPAKAKVSVLKPDERAYDSRAAVAPAEDPAAVAARNIRQKTSQSYSILKEMNDALAEAEKWDDEQEQEDDWVLDQDFVAKAMTHGDEGAEATIYTELMKPVEEMDEDEDTRAQGRPSLDDNRFETDEDEEDPEDDRFDDDDNVDGESVRQRGSGPSGSQGAEAGPSSGRAVLTNEEKLMKERFDKLAMDYDDEDDWGELDEDDPELQGKMDVTDFDNVMDKFLHENKAVSYAEMGFLPPKTAIGDPQKMTQDDIDLREAALKKTHDLATIREDRLMKGEKVIETELVLPHEHARMVDEQWDVETVVSNRSNLYNHPTLIGDKSRPHGKQRRGAASEASTQQSYQPRQIILSAKSGLPVDYLPWKETPAAGQDGVALPKQKVIGARRTLTGNDDEMDEFSDDSDGESNMTGMTTASRYASVSVREKGETTEEKKARKAAIKDARKQARVEKKEYRNQFKEENKRMSNQKVGPQPSILPFN